MTRPGMGRGCPRTSTCLALVAELRVAGAFDLEDAAGPIREASEQQLAQAREDASVLAARWR